LNIILVQQQANDDRIVIRSAELIGAEQAGLIEYA
jgi:hypothetical protein